MLNISLKLHYGLLTLIELAHYVESQPLQLKDISARHQIPPKYLEQVISGLRQAGFVQSLRGVNGGYTLAKSPEEISVLEVVKVLQGVSSVDPKVKGSVLETYWQDVMLGVDRLVDYNLAEFMATCCSGNRLSYSI